MAKDFFKSLNGAKPARAAIAPRLLDTEGAGMYTNVAPSTLKIWRSTGNGRGPAYIRLAARCVRYDVRDLDAWIDSRRVCAGH